MLDFDDNKLPVGWSLSGNIEISNQRLQGRGNAHGKLSTAVDVGSADKITISFDANLSLYDWGGLTYVQTGGVEAAARSLAYILGVDRSGYGFTFLESQILAAQVPIYDEYYRSIVRVPDFHVNYHVSTTLLNGFISQTLTNLSTSQTFESGLINAPGFEIAKANSLGIGYVFTPPPTSGTCPVGHAEDLSLDLKCIL